MNWYPDTILNAATVMMKYTDIMMNDIQHSYQAQLLPEVLYFDIVALQENIALCKITISDRIFQRQEESIKSEVN